MASAQPWLQIEHNSSLIYLVGHFSASIDPGPKPVKDSSRAGMRKVCNVASKGHMTASR